MLSLHAGLTISIDNPASSGDNTGYICPGVPGIGYLPARSAARGSVRRFLRAPQGCFRFCNVYRPQCDSSQVIGEKLERSKIMTNPPRGGFNSFRKSVRQVGALPRTTKKSSIEVWRPKLNDRVQIPNGVGIVVEISGDMYLIDLENQLAKVWERLTSIKLPK